MTLILLDTSVVIALRKSDDAHHQSAVDALSSHKGEVAIAAITLTESLIQPMRRSGAKGREAALAIADAVDHIYDFTRPIAVKTAEIRSSQNLTVADAMISATAIAHKAQLWTCDAGLAKAHKGARLLA